MTDQQSPITPPPEIVKQWAKDVLSESGEDYSTDIDLFAAKAAQWGADQELEAMLAELKALHLPDGYAAMLRAARRPKPPSLKEQALAQLGCIQIDLNKFGMGISTDTIRRAIESIPD